MKWKRDGYPTDGTKFEVIVKSSDGKRKTLAYVHSNYQRTAVLTKGTGGQYWRSFTEIIIAWRPIEEIEVEHVDDIDSDIQLIKRLMEHYSGVGQAYDTEFGMVVNEVGTYDAMHAMRVSARVMPTHISPDVKYIFDKYEYLIESRKWGLFNIYEYLQEKLDEI